LNEEPLSSLLTTSKEQSSALAKQFCGSVLVNYLPCQIHTAEIANKIFQAI